MARKPARKSRPRSNEKAASPSLELTEAEGEAEDLRLERVREKRAGAARQRVADLIADYDSEGGFSRMAAMVRRVANLQRLRDFYDDLDVISKLAAENKSARVFADAVMRLAIVKFAHGLIDSSGLYPAKLYKDYYGIPPSRLRQAARRRKLKTHQVGKTTLYAFAEVRALWPDAVTFEPTKP